MGRPFSAQMADLHSIRTPKQRSDARARLVPRDSVPRDTLLGARPATMCGPWHGSRTGFWLVRLNATQMIGEMGRHLPIPYQY